MIDRFSTWHSNEHLHDRLNKMVQQANDSFAAHDKQMASMNETIKAQADQIAALQTAINNAN